MLTPRPIRSRLGSAAAAGAAVALLAGAGLLTAGPAQADPRPCPGAGPGDPARCAQVIDIDAGSSLVMRTAPRYGAGAVARFGNGQWLELDCWTTGDPDADGHGYRYWMQVSTGSASGYVNDWYLDSGGPNVWKSRIPQCA
ncbi:MULTISPECIES: hypothetical protein [unclassified Streptomyces]|uniref:hypothetical protein n=1 Tax=unclassified Streptomyces TaxID=2593676 RepID=UPI002252FF74|nr:MULTISPECIES: hypothetical protein [unclassified Streptomyces]MCX5053266.1 hypothetical protein [Streptomyces sp. NBC_00474]MCX5243889.1 hypothetical protein [Streptomyces sp. NBC_00201]MCX5290377.1 hypothetical protein [Streptomyces sp. NBC_00183]